MVAKCQRRKGSASAAQGPPGVEKEELESLAVREAVKEEQVTGGCNSFETNSRANFQQNV